ncbi:hypothetical protein HNV12_02975 [Methanococcoides sp. SA1]|nr:hypothetical protein [Methanococcoides sp. SA1]
MGEKDWDLEYENFDNMRGMFSHDIRNPLFVINSNARLMSLVDKSEHTKGFTKKISKYTDSINHTIEALKLKGCKESIKNISDEKAIFRIRSNERKLKRASKRVRRKTEKIFHQLKKSPTNAEERHLERITSSCYRIFSVVDMTSAGTLSEEVVRKDYTRFFPTEAVEKLIYFYSQGIEIELHSHYAEGIFTNKEVFTGITNALIANAYEYALGKIDVNLRENKKGDLELSVENSHNGLPQRKSAGEGKGKGLSFVEKSLDRLGGKYFPEESPERYSATITIPTKS